MRWVTVLLRQCEPARMLDAGQHLAGTVANPTIALGKIGLSGSTGGGAAGHRVVLHVTHAVVHAIAAGNVANFRVGRLRQL